MKEKLVIYIISSILINIINIVTAFYLFRVLDVFFAGIIAFSNSLIGFFTLYLDLGIGSIYLQKNAEKDFEDYFSVYFFYKIILIIANYIPLFVIFNFLGLGKLEYEFLILRAISSAFDAIALIWSNNLLAKKKILKLSISNMIITIIKNVLIILFILNYHIFSEPLIILGEIYIFSSFSNLIIILIFSGKEFRFKKLQKKKLISFIKATRSLIITSILSVIVTNGGYLILDLSTSYENLAYYYLVDNYLITTLLLISRGIRTLLMTLFPKEFKKNNLKVIKEITHLTEKYSSIFFLMIILIVFLNAQILFRLFLPKYIESVQYLYILIFIPYFGGINKPYSSHLIPAQKQNVYSYYLLIKQIINIILIILIVPEYLFSIRVFGGGGLGLAFITFGIWALDILFFRFFSNKLGITWKKEIIYHLLLASLIFVIVKVISLLISNIILINDFIYIAFTSLSSIGLFLISLILIKELKLEDFRFFMSLLKIKNYKSSLIEELRIKEITNIE